MRSKKIKIKELMQPNPRSIYAKDSLAFIDQIFKATTYHHLPVVDEDGKIIGIVSHQDFKYAMEQIAKCSSEKIYTKEIFDQWTAERIMTHNPAILHLEDELGKAAEYFLQNKFHALPILDYENELVGIVTSHDLLEFAYA